MEDEFQKDIDEIENNLQETFDFWLLFKIILIRKTNFRFSKNVPFLRDIRKHRLKNIFENFTFKPIFILIIRTFPILPFSLGSYFIASSAITNILILVYSLIGAYFYYFSLFFIIKSA